MKLKAKEAATKKAEAEHQRGNLLLRKKSRIEKMEEARGGKKPVAPVPAAIKKPDVKKK